MIIQNHPKRVVLREDTHQYFNSDGVEYMSQSKFWSHFKKPFETEKMAMGSAIKKLKEAGNFNPTKEQIAQKSEELKSSWKKMATDSHDHGNILHGQFEAYGKGLPLIHPSFKMLVEELYEEQLLKYKWWNELDMWMAYETEEGHVIRIGGRTDRITARTKTIKVLDYDDLKTNQRRGIEYESKYGNYMLAPLDHLECCNYNHYSLQLSTYAFMGEYTYGIKAGNLTLRSVEADIDHSGSVPVLKSYSLSHIPVPYMKYEVIEALEYFGKHQIDRKFIEKSKNQNVSWLK